MKKSNKGKNSLFYVGGQLSENNTGLNMRLGTYTPGGAEMGVDLGIYESGLTIGASAFSTLGANRKKNKKSMIPVLGCGLKYSSDNIFFTGTAGFRFPVSNKGNNLDCLIDIELAEMPRLVFTLGITSYMGQR